MNIAIIVLLFLLISGCIDSEQETIPNNTIFPEPPVVVDFAKADLAQRLNITSAEVKLVKQELVNWRDTSLGYPEKGMVYAQEITPGFRIILEAQNKTYEYHSDYKRVVGPKEVNVQ